MRASKASINLRNRVITQLPKVATTSQFLQIRWVEDGSVLAHGKFSLGTDNAS